MKMLKQLRKQRGLTQSELGEIVGVAKSTLSLYETGTREPDIETLKKFADFFGVSIDTLLEHNQNTSENSAETIMRERFANDTDYRNLITAASSSRPEYLRAAFAMLQTLNKGSFLNNAPESQALSFAEHPMTPKLT